MKNLVKLAAVFALGIIVALVVILPKISSESAEISPTPDIQAEIQRAVDETVKDALAVTVTETPKETAGIATDATTESAQELEVTPEPTAAVEPVKAAVTDAKPETKPSSSPQVTATQPETWWEDGKQYTMINGHKALISDEGNNQQSSYDWENDPLKDVPGPFTGNGGN
ncbi:hypothetical protein FACS1894217_15090 [Clostridia bacterium]|nr:hypothetical protein FACS1894217_15090 [Clostridia bacterium]